MVIKGLLNVVDCTADDIFMSTVVVLELLVVFNLDTLLRYLDRTYFSVSQTRPCCGCVHASTIERRPSMWEEMSCINVCFLKFMTIHSDCYIAWI